MDIKLSIKDIAYCGLNCRMCNLTTILPETAQKLYQIMKDDGWEFFGSIVHKEFNDFWKVLNSLAGLQENCPLCKGGCGNPDCKLRICAREKGLEVCAFCNSYPCADLQEFQKGRYTFLEANNLSLREKGLERWLAEQEELVRKGLRNADLISGK